MPISALQFASALTLAGLAAAIVRVKLVGLNRTTPIFFAYLIFELIRSSTLLLFPTGSPIYYWTYILSAVPLWAFYVLMVRELFGLFFEGYPGIRTMGRYLLYAAMAIAVLVSALSLFASWHNHAVVNNGRLYYVFFIERGIVFALAVFLMIMLAYLPQYRVLLTRNVVVHSAVFGALFLGDALILLVEFLMPGHFISYLNVALELVSMVCYWAWAALLRRREETRKPPGTDAALEVPLVRQLAALNNALIRSSGGRPRPMPPDPSEFSQEIPSSDSAHLDHGSGKLGGGSKRERSR